MKTLGSHGAFLLASAFVGSCGLAGAHETCPESKVNPRVVLSGVSGTGQCNICVANSKFWFHDTIVKACGTGGHTKRKYNPTAWTSELLGPGDHSLAEYLEAGGASVPRSLLYHGTSDLNLKFMIGAHGKVDFEFGQNHQNQLSRGFYLTASPNEAKTYACQPKAVNQGRVAVLVVDAGPANVAAALVGREEKGISTRSISKTYEKRSTAMDRLRKFDAEPASFIRLSNKRNQFAFKAGAAIDGGHPQIAPRLVAVVLLGKKYQRLAETDENRKKISGSYVGRCNVEGLIDADEVKDDYTFGSLGLAESCGREADDTIPRCQEGEFQSYETAGVLNTCSSKSNPGSCNGEGKADGEHFPVPEVEADEDTAEVDDEEKDAVLKPPALMILEEDADPEDNDGSSDVKFSSSSSSLGGVVGGMTPTLLRANRVLDKLDDVLEKEERIVVGLGAEQQ
jgi:hypothetical protein